MTSTAQLPGGSHSLYTPSGNCTERSFMIRRLFPQLVCDIDCIYCLHVPIHCPPPFRMHFYRGILTVHVYLLCGCTVKLWGVCSSTYLEDATYFSTRFSSFSSRIQSFMRASHITCAIHMFTVIATCPRRVQVARLISTPVCMKRQQTLGAPLSTATNTLL